MRREKWIEEGRRDEELKEKKEGMGLERRYEKNAFPGKDTLYFTLSPIS